MKSKYNQPNSENMESLKTEFKKQKEARDLAIYNEWNELTSQPNAMRTAVTELLMKRHHIHSSSAIWQARKRVERKLGENKNINQ